MKKEQSDHVKNSHGTLIVNKAMLQGETNLVSARIEVPSEGETRLSNDVIGEDVDKVNENEQKFNDGNIVDNDGTNITYRNERLHKENRNEWAKNIKDEDGEEIEANTYESIPNPHNNEVNTPRIFRRCRDRQRLQSPYSRPWLKSGSIASKASHVRSMSEIDNDTSSGWSFNRGVLNGYTSKPMKYADESLDGIRSSVIYNQEMINKDLTLQEVGRDELRMLNDKEMANYKEPKEGIEHMQQDKQNTNTENTAEKVSHLKDASPHVLEDIETAKYIKGAGEISTMEYVASMSVKGSVILDAVQEVKIVEDAGTIKNTEITQSENNQKLDEKEKISDKTEKVENMLYQEKGLEYKSEDVDRNKNSINEHEDKDNSQKEENINDIQAKGDELVEKISDRINTVENDVRKLGENEDKENFKKDADRCLREEHEKLREDLKEIDKLGKDGYEMDKSKKGFMHKVEKIYDFLNNYVEPENQQFQQLHNNMEDAIAQLLEKSSEEVRVPVAEDNATSNNQQTAYPSSEKLAKMGNQLQSIGKKQGKSPQGKASHSATESRS